MSHFLTDTTGGNLRLVYIGDGRQNSQNRPLQQLYGPNVRPLTIAEVLPPRLRSGSYPGDEAYVTPWPLQFKPFTPKIPRSHGFPAALFMQQDWTPSYQPGRYGLGLNADTLPAYVSNEKHNVISRAAGAEPERYGGLVAETPLPTTTTSWRHRSDRARSIRSDLLHAQSWTPYASPAESSAAGGAGFMKAAPRIPSAAPSSVGWAVADGIDAYVPDEMAQGEPFGSPSAMANHSTTTWQPGPVASGPSSARSQPPSALTSTLVSRMEALRAQLLKVSSTLSGVQERAASLSTTMGRRSHTLAGAPTIRHMPQPPGPPYPYPTQSEGGLPAAVAAAPPPVYAAQVPYPYGYAQQLQQPFPYHNQQQQQQQYNHYQHAGVQQQQQQQLPPHHPELKAEHGMNFLPVPHDGVPYAEFGYGSPSAAAHMPYGMGTTGSHVGAPMMVPFSTGASSGGGAGVGGSELAVGAPPASGGGGGTKVFLVSVSRAVDSSPQTSSPSPSPPTPPVLPPPSPQPQPYSQPQHMTVTLPRNHDQRATGAASAATAIATTATAASPPSAYAVSSPVAHGAQLPHSGGGAGGSGASPSQSAPSYPYILPNPFDYPHTHNHNHNHTGAPSLSVAAATDASGASPLSPYSSSTSSTAAAVAAAAAAAAAAGGSPVLMSTGGGGSDGSAAAAAVQAHPFELSSPAVRTQHVTLPPPTEPADSAASAHSPPTSSRVGASPTATTSTSPDAPGRASQAQSQRCPFLGGGGSGGAAAATAAAASAVTRSVAAEENDTRRGAGAAPTPAAVSALSPASPVSVAASTFSSAFVRQHGSLVLQELQQQQQQQSLSPGRPSTPADHHLAPTAAATASAASGSAAGPSYPSRDPATPVSRSQELPYSGRSMWGVSSTASSLDAERVHPWSAADGVTSSAGVGGRVGRGSSTLLTAMYTPPSAAAPHRFSGGRPDDAGSADDVRRSFEALSVASSLDAARVHPWSGGGGAGGDGAESVLSYHLQAADGSLELMAAAAAPASPTSPYGPLGDAGCSSVGAENNGAEMYGGGVRVGSRGGGAGGGSWLLLSPMVIVPREVGSVTAAAATAPTTTTTTTTTANATAVASGGAAGPHIAGSDNSSSSSSSPIEQPSVGAQEDPAEGGRAGGANSPSYGDGSGAGGAGDEYGADGTAAGGVKSSPGVLPLSPPSSPPADADYLSGVARDEKQSSPQLRGGGVNGAAPGEGDDGEGAGGSGSGSTTPTPRADLSFAFHNASFDLRGVDNGGGGGGGGGGGEAADGGDGADDDDAYDRESGAGARIGHGRGVVAAEDDGTAHGETEELGKGEWPVRKLIMVTGDPDQDRADGGGGDGGARGLDPLYDEDEIMHTPTEGTWRAHSHRYGSGGAPYSGDVSDVDSCGGDDGSLPSPGSAGLPSEAVPYGTGRRRRGGAGTAAAVGAGGDGAGSVSGAAAGDYYDGYSDSEGEDGSGLRESIRASSTLRAAAAAAAAQQLKRQGSGAGSGGGNPGTAGTATAAPASTTAAAEDQPHHDSFSFPSSNATHPFGSSGGAGGGGLGLLTAGLSSARSSMSGLGSPSVSSSYDAALSGGGSVVTPGESSGGGAPGSSQQHPIRYARPSRIVVPSSPRSSLGGWSQPSPVPSPYTYGVVGVRTPSSGGRPASNFSLRKHLDMTVSSCLFGDSDEEEGQDEEGDEAESRWKPEEA